LVVPSPVPDHPNLPPLGLMLSFYSDGLRAPPVPRRRAAPSASQSDVDDAGAPSPSKKVKPPAAAAVKAAAAKTAAASKVVAGKKKGAAPRSGPQVLAKRIKGLTVAALSKAVQEAARAAMAIAVRLRDSNARGSSTTSDAAPTTSVTKEVVFRAVLDGLQPVLLEVVQSANDVENLRADLSRLAQKVEVQGAGHEMTARAVVQLQDQPPVVVKPDVSVNPNFVADPDESPIDVEALTAANKNYSDMAVVRSELRKVLESKTALTTKSGKVLCSPDRLSLVMSDVVERLRGCDVENANTYLFNPTIFPVRNKPTKTKWIKIQKPLSGHVSRGVIKSKVGPIVL